MLDEATVNRIKDTMRSVCRSPNVHCYKIGFTSAPSFKRANSHRNKWGYTSFIILADCLTRDEALHLEEALFREATSDRKSILWKRHEPETREGPYRRSYGGTPADKANLNSHCVYMIWQ